MATYYVDGTNGNDGNDGLSADVTTASGPFATIGAAVSAISSSDVVYIAPGIYGETVTVADAGVTFYGDVTASQDWAANIHPGRVIVTNDTVGDLTGTPQAGIVWNMGTGNNVLCYDIDCVGTTGNAWQGGTSATNQTCYRCSGYSSGVGGSDSAFYRLQCEYCVGIGGRYGFRYCMTGYTGYCRWCLSISPHAYRNCTCENCFSFGGEFNYMYSSSKNCTAIGGYYGVYHDDGTDSDPGAVAYSNLLVGNANATHTGGVVDALAEYCMLVACTDDFSGTFATAGPSGDFSTNRTIYSQGDGVSNSATAGHPFLFPPPLQMIFNVANAFRPQAWNDYAMGAGGNESALADAMGCARVAYGVPHIGATSVAKVETRYDTLLGNVYRIYRAGQTAIRFGLKAGEAVNITVSYIANMAGGPTTAGGYPAIEVLDYDGTSIGTDTGTATSGTLTVPIGGTEYPVTHDREARLILKALEPSTETAGDAYADFYNIAITAA